MRPETLRLVLDVQLVRGGAVSALPREVLTPEQRVETWALYHLARARQSRNRMERLQRGTVAYGAENYFRHLALQRAAKHIATLQHVGCPLSAELVDAITAEGL